MALPRAVCALAQASFKPRTFRVIVQYRVLLYISPVGCDDQPELCLVYISIQVKSPWWQLWSSQRNDGTQNELTQTGGHQLRYQGRRWALDSTVQECLS